MAMVSMLKPCGSMQYISSCLSELASLFVALLPSQREVLHPDNAVAIARLFVDCAFPCREQEFHLLRQLLCGFQTELIRQFTPDLGNLVF